MIRLTHERMCVTSTEHCALWDFVFEVKSALHSKKSGVQSTLESENSKMIPECGSLWGAPMHWDWTSNGKEIASVHSTNVNKLMGVALS